MKHGNKEISIHRSKDVSIPRYMDIEISKNQNSFQSVKNAKTEFEWESMSKHTVREAIGIWLSTLSKLTAKNYASGMRQIEVMGYLNTEITLQALGITNLESVVDRIKKDSVSKWSECTRQARAACFISFSSFLSRHWPAIFRKAQPCKDGTSKTFFRVHEKTTSNAMTPDQWKAFLEELGNLSHRDSLIARLALQGGKRINEVLSLDCSQINWEKGEITFQQSKTKGLIKHTVITYPQSLLRELREYIGPRAGLVFVTKTGKAVQLQYIGKNFARAGELAGVPFHVSPHCLRATCITYLKSMGISDSEIMKISGHANSAMVFAYDKSDRADNASKKISLVS